MPLPDQAAVQAQIAAFESELAGAKTPRDAQSVRDRFLGRRQSVVASWMQQIASAAPDEKKAIGRFANELKQAIESRWAAYQAQAEARTRPAGAVDVTLPGRVPPLGHRHPLTVVRDEMEEIFTRMGFAIVEGPEVEDDWHCFDALNMPAEHPARDMQDTLYLSPAMPAEGWTPAGPRDEAERRVDLRTLLRTHTSAMQIRYMQAHEPPIRIVVPGRVYRRDDLDLTHTPMFTQMEGLVVGEGVSLADLNGTLLEFARGMFGASTRVRLRPSFFPYTEPSAELDVSCWQCGGSGCAMCKRSGWLEILGCGMVHPAVFEAVGYDADRYTGFAWGMGIERVAILRYQVDDIRLFFENDLRFLEQFPVPMRLLVSWLRDFVDAGAPPREIADRLGLRGFEVATVEPTGDNDAVIDFEITANRPDCLSVLGLAREVATAYGLPLRVPSTAPGARLALATQAAGETDRVRVTVEDADLCPRYVAAVAELTPAVSPAWMTERLQASGVRPISAIVDVTNYVLLELGHPMHAFDLARLEGPEIRVRRAKPGEVVRTLDGIDRQLDAEMLVIADATRAQGIGGVMGGADSEVSDATRTIVFESAYFKPASVRRTSKRLNLKTEASARFERGADINGAMVAMQRAIALMTGIGAGRAIGPAVDRYPRPRDGVTIRLRRHRIGRLLGLTVDDADVARILEGLGLIPSPAPDGWDVGVPTFRVDLVREADLIEEVGRHVGFDRLPATFPAQTAPAPPPDPRIPRDRLVRRVLTAAGLSEAVAFGFVEEKSAEAFTDAANLVRVANPLSATFEVMRPSLLPGLVGAVAHNRRHGRRDVGLFEIGTRFTRQGETRGVGIAWTGAGTPEHWSQGAREVDFFDVKGVVERLCDALGFAPQFEPVDAPALVSGQSAAVSAAGSALGRLGLVAPAVVEAQGAPRSDKVFVAELDLDAAWFARAPAFESARPLPRFPSVVRDLSVVVDDALPAAIIRGTILAVGADAPAPLVDVTFFDRYHGTGVPEGRVSVSVRLTFRAADRTLTDAEVQRSFDTILAALVREYGAVQR